MATQGTQLVPTDTEGDGVGIEKQEGVMFDADLAWSAEGATAVAFCNDFVVVEADALTAYIAE